MKKEERRKKYKRTARGVWGKAFLLLLVVAETKEKRFCQIMLNDN